MGLRNKVLNMFSTEAQKNEAQKVDNSVRRSTQDFLRYGNRDKLFPTWSDVKMPDSDMYRGYSYAVIQKRSNKVATLAKNNLRTWANPKIVDEFQKRDEVVQHPYLKLIENSTKFSEKQFWKNISIYLDLAGRYYLGVVRSEIKPLDPKLPTITTDPTEFVMLNPYEVRRVVNSDGEVAGYIERKKDGRYREWALHQIIEMRELNPFDPEQGQWAMTDAAKDAVFTINQSSDYTKQSLNGNIEAPGIITTDVLLSDEDFANFRSRVTQHTKGEPLFGNGAGAIKWDSMQIDLDKAALMDINEINRTTLFAVSGTSKTSLGIEQSGTTRETARVQSEQFVSDTAQPRLEDIVDFLNLDYKRHYNREYQKTGYYIEVTSAVSKDYAVETQAVGMRQAQVQLAMQLMQSGYTMESAYQFAEGEIDLKDLELEKGQDKPINPEAPQEPESPTEPTKPNAPTNAPEAPQGGSNDKDDKTPISETNNDLGLDLAPHADLVENGGKGSGNFGHKGRPGEVGGSASQGGSTLQGAAALENTGVDLVESDRDFFNEHPEQVKEVVNVINEFKKIGLDANFTFTINKGQVAQNLDETFSNAWSGRALTAGDGKTTVYVSRDSFENPRKGEYRQGEEPIVVDSSLVGIVRHELGHALVVQKYLKEIGYSGQVLSADDYQKFNSKLFRESGAKRPIAWNPEDKGKWSKYAETNNAEAIAEAFSKPDYSEDTRKVYEYVRNYKPKAGIQRNSVSNGSACVLCIGYPRTMEELEAIAKEQGVELHSEGENCSPLTCTCDHDHKIETYVNQLSVQNGKVLNEAYNSFLSEVRSIEKETIDYVASKLTINAFGQDDLIGKKKKKSLWQKLQEAVYNYWWAIMPMFTQNSMDSRNKEFDKNIAFVFTNDIQSAIGKNADKVAEGHLETILGDILEATNKAYTEVAENAAAELIVEAYEKSPARFDDYFHEPPTRVEALEAVRKTDILEQNKRIYEKANRMAYEGYDRRTIIKAIRNEYKDISAKRAETIARNETSRAFTQSQFEADSQFLKAVNKLDSAYKVWYSRRPANEQDKICPYCRHMIDTTNENPVPFDKPFLEYGNSIEVVDDDGKVKTFVANYEDINGGTLHVNCQCGYHLVFKNSAGEFVKTLNEVGQNDESNNLDDDSANGGFDSTTSNEKTLNGGKGSGNFGHKGRPGEVGGSASEKANENPETLTQEEYEANAKKFADSLTDEELDLCYDYLNYPIGTEANRLANRSFVVGGDKYTMGEYVKKFADDEARKEVVDAINERLARAKKDGRLRDTKSLTFYDPITAKRVLGKDMQKYFREHPEADYQTYNTYEKNPRGDWELRGRYLSKELLEKMNRLSELIEKKGISFDKDIKVERLVNDELLQIMRDRDGGGNYTQYGFTSTSGLPMGEIGKQTRSGFGNNKIEIVIPKGTKVAFLENIEDKKYPDSDNRFYKDQHEILLDYETTFHSDDNFKTMKIVKGKE